MEIVIKKPTIPGAEKPGCEHPPAYRGKPGPQGPAGTVEIVQVVTIEPSDPARVENIGDKTNAKLILYIPKGDPGNRGEPGPAVEITEDIIQAIINELDLTPELVGLGNVDNTSDMDKPVSTAQAEAVEKVQSDVDNHVADTNNPHGVTIGQIGAAPAGYGLGKLTTYDVYSDAEIDAVLVDIINGMGDHVFKRITLSFKSTTNFTNAGGHYYTDIYKLSTNYAMITIKSYVAGGRELQRVWYNGVLEPWEWVNPPMVAGVEYRTTERHDGNPVYRKLVVYTHSGQFGDSATNTDYTIPHGISDWAKSVRCVTSINNDVTGFYLGSTGGILCVYGFGATNINVRAYKTYFNSPIFRFDLAYIKK